MTETPGTRLQAARLEAGWSQPRLMAAMKASAPQADITLPGNPSLKTQLTRWENGHKIPGLDYRRLFRLVYGKTDSELGFPESALPALESSGFLFSASAVAYFQRMLSEQAKADNLMGPRLLVDVAREQAKTLARAARDARGSMRLPILTTASRYHEFTGWLLQDLGCIDEAMTYTDRARDLATELPDPFLQTHLLMRKSNIATDANNPALGAALADAALRTSSSLPPRLKATVLRQLANSYAGLREIGQVQSSIDQALDVVQLTDPGETEIADYCTEPYVAMEAGSCWLQLGKPSKALTIFETVELEWPDHVQRDKGLSLARLAHSHALVGDSGAAIVVGGQAVQLAMTTSSRRTVRELQLLRSSLVRWTGNPEVAALRQSVAGLVASAA